MDALERENLLQIIQKQVHRYPKLQVQDLYKLLFQAACGGEHLLSETSEARDFLFAEWQTLSVPFENEPLVESIDPKNQIIRVNLRPFKEKGGRPEQIFILFQRSAETVSRDTGMLKTYWTALGEMVLDVELSFRIDNIQTFWETMTAEGFPPVHHSKIYRQAYQPHYRVLLRRYWEGRETD